MRGCRGAAPQRAPLWGCRAAAALGLLLAAQPAWAEPRAAPPVHLQLDGCVEAQAAVRRLFLIESDARLVPAAEAGATAVSARCPEGGGPLELRVDDPLTGKSLRRGIDLAAARPRARPRLLALALAELLFASWTELELQPTPALPPTLPPEAPAPAPPPPRPTPAAADAADAAREAARAVLRRRVPGLARSGLRLTARGAGQLFVQGGALLAGAAMQLGGDHGRRLGWSFDAAYLTARTSGSLGTLSTDAINGGLSLLFQHGIDRGALRLGLRAGGGLRAGAVRLSGVPASGARAEGASFWAAQVGPTGVLSGSLGLPRRLVLDLQIEGGYLLTPAYGLIDGAQAVALAGPWLGLQLGIGVTP